MAYFDDLKTNNDGLAYTATTTNQPTAHSSDQSTKYFSLKTSKSLDLW